ncbi:hypothetical protein LWT92_21780 [Enterobacter hormaechei]|nr:hypothetical protein [Enterobacter hormaechei]
MRPAITTAATSCAGRERSRASASPAVTICALPERWRGAPAVPDSRGHLRSSAPGHHHGGNLLRGAGTVTRQRVTCRHDLHPAGTAGVALRLCRTPGGICAAVRPVITTVMALRIAIRI